MPGIPDVIVKAPVFGRLETLMGSLSKTSQVVIDAIDDLEQGVSVAKVAKDNGLYVDDAQAQHLKRDWLNETGQGWWPAVNTDGIIRAGLVKALRRFQLSGKPFEVFWVISGAPPAAAPWVMSITEGKQQITIMFHTPRYAAGIIPVEQDNMWVSLEEGGDVDVRNVLGPPPPPPKAVAVKSGVKKKKKKKKKKKSGTGPKKTKRAKKKA